MNDRVTNAEFAKSDTGFQEACEKAGIKPTTRQAAKWRRKEGLAYKAKNITVLENTPGNKEEIK